MAILLGLGAVSVPAKTLSGAVAYDLGAGIAGPKPEAAVTGVRVQEDTARSATPVSVVELQLRNGWFTISGRAGHAPLRLVLDTGANTHGVTNSVARYLALPKVGWTRLHGGSGTETAWLVHGNRISFGRAVAGPGNRLVVEDEFVTDEAGVQYDGIIGIDLMRSYDVAIDGPRREIRFFRPGQGAGDNLGAPVGLHDLGRELIGFSATVNSASVTAILDTGAPYMLMNTAAALASGVEITGEPFTLAPRGVGSWDIPAVPARMATLDIGQTRFHQVNVVVADLALFESLGLSDRRLVIVGAPILEACEFLVSLARSSMRICHSENRAAQSQTATQRVGH